VGPGYNTGFLPPSSFSLYFLFLVLLHQALFTDEQAYIQENQAKKPEIPLREKSLLLEMSYFDHAVVTAPVY
jgi:hypothetical protein